MNDFNRLFKMFSEADENEGFAGGGGVLPKGTYPVEVSIEGSGVSDTKGTPFAELRLSVIEGPFSGQACWVTVYLPMVTDPGFQAAYEQALRNKAAGGKYGEKGSAEAKAHRAFTGTATLLKKLGVVPAPVPPGCASRGHEALAYWNVEAWEGRKMLADLGVETVADQEAYARSVGKAMPESGYRDRQRLNGWHEWDADTRKEWLGKEVPRQTQLAEDIRTGKVTVGSPAKAAGVATGTGGAGGTSGGPAVNI